MQQSDDLSPLEIVEMFAGLSCFLKDSSDVSQTLLDDFRMCQGYTFLIDLMIRWLIFNYLLHKSSGFYIWRIMCGQEEGYFAVMISGLYIFKFITLLITK